jgi:hypothetical protein
MTNASTLTDEQREFVDRIKRTLTTRDPSGVKRDLIAIIDRLTTPSTVEPAQETGPMPTEQDYVDAQSMTADKCASCGEIGTSESIEREVVPYGDAGKSVSVFVPVITCLSCGFQYTDYRAEAIHEAAVKYEMSTPTTSPPATPTAEQPGEGEDWKIACAHINAEDREEKRQVEVQNALKRLTTRRYNMGELEADAKLLAAELVRLRAGTPCDPKG